jgi:hypothetical protein
MKEEKVREIKIKGYKNEFGFKDKMCIDFDVILVLTLQISIDISPMHLEAVSPKGFEHGVIQRQKEARATWVSLPARPTAELPVDATRLVALGAQHHQAA